MAVLPVPFRLHRKHPGVASWVACSTMQQFDFVSWLHHTVLRLLACCDADSHKDFSGAAESRELSAAPELKTGTATCVHGTRSFCAVFATAMSVLLPPGSRQLLGGPEHKTGTARVVTAPVRLAFLHVQRIASIGSPCQA